MRWRGWAGKGGLPLSFWCRTCYRGCDVPARSPDVDRAGLLFGGLMVLVVRARAEVGRCVAWGPMFEYTCTVMRVVDGDTLMLDIDVGFRMHYQSKCRLARVNAPEMLEFGGVQARLFVESELAKAAKLVVTSKRLDKYGRVLGEVRFTRAVEPDAWVNLSDLLLSTGHGVPYRW